MEVPRPFKCSCTLWPTSGIKNFFSELVTDSENGCFFNPFRMNLVKYPQRNIILPLEKGYPLSSNCYYYSVDILTAKNLVVSKKILWSIPSYQYFGYLCHQLRKNSGSDDTWSWCAWYEVTFLDQHECNCPLIIFVNWDWNFEKTEHHFQGVSSKMEYKLNLLHKNDER